MTDTAIIERDVVVPAASEASRTPFSWSAAIAGALAAAGVTFIIVALGSGIGLSFASPYGSGPSATSLTIAAAVWLVMAQTRLRAGLSRLKPRSTATDRRARTIWLCGARTCVHDDRAVSCVRRDRFQFTRSKGFCRCIAAYSTTAPWIPYGWALPPRGCSPSAFTKWRKPRLAGSPALPCAKPPRSAGSPADGEHKWCWTLQA